MSRCIPVALLGACALVALSSRLAAAQAPASPPLLCAYEGAGSDGVKGMVKLDNMRGVTTTCAADFNDYTQTPSNALANLNWALGNWQSDKNISQVVIAIGLAFNGASTADIATGKDDATYQQMGAALVANGFPNAVIRLGWEMNGGWYPWGQKGAAFATAFARVSSILHATPGSNFTVAWNPASGIDPSSEMPANAAGIDDIEGDDYLNSWNCGGCKQQEPDLFNGNNTGNWGFISFLNEPGSTRGFWTAGRRTAVGEWGVGSRGDGHGACPSTSSDTNPPNWAGCDDGPGMALTLNMIVTSKPERSILWDYNAGDYNSQISNGARPAEALEFLKVYGSPQDVALLAGSTLYTATDHPAAAPSGYHAIRAQLSNGHIEQIAWGEAPGQVQQLTDLSASATASPAPSPTPAPAPAKVVLPVATGVAQPVSAAPTLPLVANADGSAHGSLTIPPAGKPLNWSINISPPRKLGWSDANGNLTGPLWGNGQEFSAFSWNDTTGAGAKANIYVAPN